MSHAMRLLALTALALLGACGNERWGPDAVLLDGAATSATEYFPGVAFYEAPKLDEAFRDDLSAMLRGAGEPPLPATARSTLVGGISLRLLWMPSFEGAVIVRITPTTGGLYRLVAKRVTPPQGTPEDSLDRMLSLDESVALERLVESSQILHSRTREGGSGIDGARWIFEAADREHYLLVQRWSPGQGPTRDIGTMMLALSGWNLGDVY